MRLDSLLLAVLSATVAATALAQTHATAAKVDTSKAFRISSPNRTTLQAAAAASGGGGGSKGIATAPLNIVDADGKIVGRYATSPSWGYGPVVALAYNGQTMLTTLDVAVDPTLGALGFTWADPTGNSKQTVYSSADCSGAAYIHQSYLGSPYLGMSVIEAGQMYVVVAETRPLFVSLSSVFEHANSACFSFSPFSGGVFPVVATLPANQFGIPPFSVR